MSLQQVEVLVPIPILEKFSYLLPSRFKDNPPRPGSRVIVPFGNRNLVGVVWDVKKNITARKFNQNTMFYRIVKNSLQSSKFRNLYWIWNINKKYNKLTIFNDLKSILLITISSMKRYGIK